MKEHLFAVAKLGASDRAALQSLIPLASGLGAGTIFGLFFVGRRRAGFAVFESIAIVAVLVAVATTAYYCIALLHRDTAITNEELAETAVPLVVAAVLLILISIVARLQGATQRVAVLLPLVLVAVIAAIELASSGVAVEPTAAPVVALVILAAGAAFGALGTVIDGRARRTVRRAEHDRLALLTGRGYAAIEGRLAVAMPRLAGEAAPPAIDLWRRDGRAFLDGPGALRLRDTVDERWQSMASGDAHAPTVAAAPGDAEPLSPGAPGPSSGSVLLEVEAMGGPRRAAAPRELRVATLRPGAEPPRHTATLTVTGDGLFDITDLVA
ncbi:MAG TPA: hypothetical protein VHZ54_09790 [Solirubrobacterales bacterium]|nr:hypothetical protein [Solirubrobacterales bacterium]